jgi:hypothetical protein
MRLRPVTVVIAVLFWTLGPQQGSAQGDQQYLALLDSYATGDVTGAVTALSAWPEARVRTAVRTVDAQIAHDRARTAIMLHTDAALDGSPDGREPFHVDVARTFLRRLTDRGARDFAARWHALIGILYCMREDEKRARLEINLGLALDTKHKDVNLVAGALVEHRVGREEPNLRGGWTVDPKDGDLLARSLHQAAEGYRVIVSNHPDFLEAQLRLGWVLDLNNSPQRAREQLEAVVARATRADLLYLAHLFLGSLHERANRLGEAAREYEAARAVAPLQSSIIALIHVEAALGHHDRARSLAAEISTTAGPAGVDPWHFYNVCFTGGGLLEGLRAEARQH